MTADDCDGGKGGGRRRHVGRRSVSIRSEIRIKKQVLSKFSGAQQKYWGNFKITNPSKLPISKKNSAR